MLPKKRQIINWSTFYSFQQDGTVSWLCIYVHTYSIPPLNCHHTHTCIHIKQKTQGPVECECTTPPTAIYYYRMHTYKQSQPMQQQLLVIVAALPLVVCMVLLIIRQYSRTCLFLFPNWLSFFSFLFFSFWVCECVFLVSPSIRPGATHSFTL